LEKYLTEKNKIETIKNKDIEYFKKDLEEIDKKYTNALKSYLEQLQNCSHIKGKLEMLIEHKNIYENMIFNFQKEIHNIKLIANISKIKGTDNLSISNRKRGSNKLLGAVSFNYGFNALDDGKNKMLTMEAELTKIKKKLAIIDYEIEITNKTLLQSVSVYNLLYLI
jgi:hypothetical protein